MSIWLQRKLTLQSQDRGCHLITHEIESLIREDITGLSVGLVHLFLQHSSASISVNENCDPDVRSDMEMALNKLVPESWPYKHSAEGSDDMPAHVKSSLFGVSITVPITDGKLALGIWQGIWLCEHRDCGGNRTLIVTIQGQPKIE